MNKTEQKFRVCRMNICLLGRIHSKFRFVVRSLCYAFFVGFVQSVSTTSTTFFFIFLLHVNSFQSRKGLDVDIVTANASKESDKLQILNSIALPHAATKQLQMDANLSHERYSEMKRGDVGNDRRAE